MTNKKYIEMLVRSFAESKQFYISYGGLMVAYRFKNGKYGFRIPRDARFKEFDTIEDMFNAMRERVAKDNAQYKKG